MDSSAGLTVALNSEVIERLKRALSGVEGLVFAALFGSTVKRGFSTHDIDIAVKASKDKYEVMVKVKEVVSRELKICEDIVDIVDVDRADVCLKKHILENSIVLIDKGYLKSLVREVTEKYPEYEEYLKLSIREWLNSQDPTKIDLEIVKRRVDFMKSEAEFLERHVISKSSDEVESSPILRRLLERSYQLIIEAVVDICKQIVSAKGWGPVYTSRGFIEECGKHGVVGEDIARELSRSIRLRNIIVHRYLNIDYKKLYIEAKKLINMVREFEKQLVQYLKKDYSLI
jgi:uncharacterized protein YutE (UPF0331/DUF86 family)